MAIKAATIVYNALQDVRYASVQLIPVALNANKQTLPTFQPHSILAMERPIVDFHAQQGRTKILRHLVVVYAM